MGARREEWRAISGGGGSCTGALPLWLVWGGILRGSSVIVGIGMFLRVFHRWTRGCAHNKACDVVLCEVDGIFTHGSAAGPTLGDGVLVMIAVRRSMISQMSIFFLLS